MLLWTSPSLKAYDDALAIVIRENEKGAQKHGPSPPSQLAEFRYVQAFGYTEREILESNEQWLQDMYTCYRWSRWVENDELERIREKPDEKTERNLATKQDVIAERAALGPKFAHWPLHAIASLLGLEMVDIDP